MKFDNRFYYLLIGSIIFFLSAFSLEKYNNTDRLLHRYIHTIESNLYKQSQKIKNELSREVFITNRFIRTQEVSDIREVEKLSAQPFNICLYDQDSLIFWSNAFAFPDSQLLKQFDADQKPIFKKLSNGYFVLQKHPLPYLNDTKKYAISIIPIKWMYSDNLTHLGSHFEAGNGSMIPTQIAVNFEKTAYPVQAIDKTILFYLKNTGVIHDHNVSKWILILYLLGFVFLGVFISKIAHLLVENYPPWIGPAFLLVSVFGIRYLGLDWSAHFQDFQVFERSFDNPHVSIGDLLINIVLLLWVVIFIHRASKDKDFKINFSRPVRLFLTAMNYLSVILALLLLISVLKSLVLNSGIDFNFKNVFSLDQYSVFAVLALILLLFTQFVFSHRMMITIHKLNLSKQERLLALGFAIILALPIIYFINLEIPLLYTILISFIFVITYDLFIDIPNPGLLWLAGWVILFAGFSSSLLYNYSLDKAEKNEEYLAQQLAIIRDSLAEEAILNFKDALYLNNETPFLNTTHTAINEEAKSLFESAEFKQHYLYTNYEYTIYAFDGQGQSIQKDLTTLNWEEWKAQIQSPIKFEADPNIFLNTSKAGNYAYYYIKTLNRLDTTQNNPLLVFEFKKAARKSAKVYTNLLAQQEFKKLHTLSDYNYAVIKEGTPILEEGIKENEIFFEKEPSIGKFERTYYKDLVNIMYRFGENDFVILSKARNNLLHPISLFSTIFGFLVIMVLIFAFLNYKFKILPDNFNFKFWNKPSLKNRIQFQTVTIIVISFIIISFVSFYFLTDSYRSYDKNRLKRKTSGVQTSAEQYLHLEKDSLNLLKNHIGELSKAQRIDVNLFDLNGHLIEASETDIFKRGILPPKMNAYAFEYFEKHQKAGTVEQKESIAHQEFISAYVPISNSLGQKVAYLGIPYANQQRNSKDDVLNFMGNLLNVYVFLLIIAGGISVYVANTITQPISAIGENLKELKLGKPNKPLEWRTNDEIGALIGEYNRMILKLEHSAKLLARSEREGAWREMAKQVAHEIKNPLTPMKLSIQYLQHAFKSNPENIEPLLKRVSHTLIEQIDSLAQIASEFSNFAKMPRANNQQIKLNDLVDSVHDLFKKSENVDVSLSLPSQDFYVFADKNHLMRVLNNMIKNAIEAIPDSRQGKINVSLYKKEEMAVIQVEDNGVGIPENMQAKVFVPNFTTKSSGTGLGLAISKKIIESVSGKIYFETEQNVGTNFFIELPLEDMLI